MLKTHQYIVDIFGEPVWLCIGGAEDLVKWAKEQFEVDLAAPRRKSGSHICLEGEDGSFVNILWMPSFDHGVMDLASLVHEVVHYAVETLHNHKIPLVTETDDGRNVNSELLAYFIGQIYREFLKMEEADDRPSLYDVSDSAGNNRTVRTGSEADPSDGGDGAKPDSRKRGRKRRTPVQAEAEGEGAAGSGVQVHTATRGRKRRKGVSHVRRSK